MGDVEALSSVMASIQLRRMIGEPGTERRLRFGEVDVKGWTEETMVKRKNIITQVVELRDSFNCLTISFTFENGVVCTMTLCIAKSPNGKDGVENIVDDREKARFVKQLGLSS